VLVAEDDEFSAQLFYQLLARSGHHVRIVKDGREAVELLDRARFDVLLLDLHMPNMDGFQVIRVVRERERATGEHLPVIALTARRRPEDRERVLAAGIDDFLAKPIQAGALSAAIERVTAATAPAALAAARLHGKRPR
jgi:CheY-like chemotaxis protein